MNGHLAGKVMSLKWLVCLSVLVCALAPFSHAQKADRKVVFKTAPEYPVALKQARIGGVVRLQIVISPRGSVDTVVALGGNAALVEAATRAVKKWKYVPADSETTKEVEFSFDPVR